MGRGTSQLERRLRALNFTRTGLGKSSKQARAAGFNQKVDITAIMRARIDQAAPTAGMLPQLVSIGLVAAATVILFSIASFSFLDTGEETLAESGSSRAGVLSAGATSLKPDFEPSPEGDASASLQQSRRAAEIATSAPETPQASGSEVTAAEPSLAAGAVSAPADASVRTLPAAPITDKIWQNQTPQREQADLLLDGDTPAQDVPSGQGVGYPLSPHAAFRYRVKKECGPIINDPVLYRHCVSTFGIHYR